ncbi:hypothetical protein P168DRAFT_36349 [Aspergillus campestris IBT 28561]|uniref:Uncharacterized protein n=1 Tax=Aspergillus campestris (strain IBT 28561) TaxID=1392248 RepID=A0A2I1CW60_ASPC2|nr:uncharacterized protein P168DRAFT_36349 [Aspergillus campestris IBT 28561]PKY01863.1 hypothetical protein P168DRAFT_36349 [Aspergillus campestris IBT 28561]
MRTKGGKIQSLFRKKTHRIGRRYCPSSLTSCRPTFRLEKIGCIISICCVSCRSSLLSHRYVGCLLTSWKVQLFLPFLFFSFLILSQTRGNSTVFSVHESHCTPAPLLAKFKTLG